MVSRSSMLVFAAILTVLTGCSGGVSVASRSPESAYLSRQRSVLTGDRVSLWTEGVARAAGAELRGEYAVDPAEAIVLLEADASAASLTAAAELRLDRALGSSVGREAAVLAAAHRASRALQSPAALDSTGLQLAMGIYNRAVAELAPLLHARLQRYLDPADPLGPISFEGPAGSFTVRSSSSYSEMIWPADYFDRLVDADRVRVTGLSHQHRIEGLGAAMIGFRENRPERTGQAPFSPPEGFAYPVTARLEFDDASSARFVLSDPLRTPTVRFGEAEYTQSADLSAPLGYLHSKTNLASLGYRGLLNSDAIAEQTGLYLLDPFDPGRIPLVLVHGLKSSPETWANLVNEIRGDPKLRDRYQLWMFLYPTSLPTPRSAFYLRQAVGDVRRAYDPYQVSPAMQQAVIVGHSMGGILTKAVLSDVGDALWEAVFTRPLEDLELTDTSRQHLDETFFYEPLEGFGRAVFIAAPLRGSPMADGWVAKLGSWFLDEPDEVEEVGAELLKNGDVFQGSVPRGWDGGSPTSIQNLSPSSPSLGIWVNLPVPLPHHVIMGDRGKPNARVPGDGVVPLASSRLSGAQSELVVPAAHNAHEHPLAIREVRRILRLHLATLAQSETD